MFNSLDPNQEARVPAYRSGGPALHGSFPAGRGAVPGPSSGEVLAVSTVIPAKETTIQKVDEVRAALGGQIAVLYDVSPPASSHLSPSAAAQELFELQEKYPRVVVCDHHNGAAPIREACGLELTAAEVVAEMLPRLWREGVLSLKGGEPVRLVAVTNSANIDPDSLICRLLIESFCDPERRALVWNPPVLDMLLRAARFGDTSFFGGLDIKNLTYETLSDHERLALALLRMINEEKADLVVRKRFSHAVTIANIRRAHDQLVADAAQRTSRTGEITLAKEILALGAEGIERGLRSILGDRYRSAQDVIEALHKGAQELSKHSGRSEAEEFRALQHRFVFRRLSRSQVREVFQGKTASDVFGPSHPAYFGAEAVGTLFSSIVGKMDELIRQPLTFEPKVRRFIDDLQHVHRLGAALSRVESVPGAPDKSVAITRLEERLDYEGDKLQAEQRHPIWDWLREASAAFGAPWLHVMNRRGILVISARFPCRDEQRPDVNLAEPGAVAELARLEEEGLARMKKSGDAPQDELPQRPMIKANLWLFYGRPHFSEAEAVALLLRQYDSIVSTNPPGRQRVMPSVRNERGETIPYDGAYHVTARWSND